MTPESVTLATEAVEVYQRTTRSVRGDPLASFGVAVARAVCPATSDTGMETTTDATWGGEFSTATTDVPPDEHAATLKTMPVTARMKVRIGCVLLGSVIRRLD